jgi:hypothetical protein
MMRFYKKTYVFDPAKPHPQAARHNGLAWRRFMAATRPPSGMLPHWARH